jgi:PilZ domain-containing protein
MSARKIGNASSLHQQVTVEARQTRLALSYDSVIVQRNGIEFRSPGPFAPWTEMTLTLQSPRDNQKVNCSGVVIACTGNKHIGYHISMVFTGLTKQAEARLNAMASSTAV